MKLMNRLRYILTAVVGLVVALYLAVLLLTALPGVQRWMARQTADALSSKLGTRVEVGRVRLDLFNSVTVDSLLIFDQQGSPHYRRCYSPDHGHPVPVIFMNEQNGIMCCLRKEILTLLFDLKSAVDHS